MPSDEKKSKPQQSLSALYTTIQYLTGNDKFFSGAGG